MVFHTFVPGTPVPQGSVNSFRGRIVGVSPKLRVWRDSVRALTVARYKGAEVLDEPVHVDMVFQLEPPQRPRWYWPAVKPDLDKLVRAVLDSLSTTSSAVGVIRDDARVVSLTAAKTYHGTPGVFVTVSRKIVP